jgi:hypothetical protein
VAAIVCVDRFMAAPDAGSRLTALQESTSPYAQGKVRPARRLGNYRAGQQHH